MTRGFTYLSVIPMKLFPFPLSQMIYTEYNPQLRNVNVSACIHYIMSIGYASHFLPTC